MHARAGEDKTITHIQSHTHIVHYTATHARLQDLAFHMVPLAVVDPFFAKEQLTLFLREW